MKKKFLFLVVFVPISYLLCADDVVKVDQFVSMPDGSISGVVLPEIGVVSAVPLRVGGFTAITPTPVSGFDTVPVPLERSLELAQLSNEELGKYSYVRQQALLRVLNRIESIQLSLALWGRRVEVAKANGTVTPDAMSVAEDLRRCLLDERAFRNKEIADLKPDLSQAIAEERRRGMAVRDLPSLLKSEQVD